LRGNGHEKIPPVANEIVCRRFTRAAIGEVGGKSLRTLTLGRDGVEVSPGRQISGSRIIIHDTQGGVGHPLVVVALPLDLPLGVASAVYSWRLSRSVVLG
jgi:hypothetical protein